MYLTIGEDCSNQPSHFYLSHSKASKENFPPPITPIPITYDPTTSEIRVKLKVIINLALSFFILVIADGPYGT